MKHKISGKDYVTSNHLKSFINRVQKFLIGDTLSNSIKNFFKYLIIFKNRYERMSIAKCLMTASFICTLYGGGLFTVLFYANVGNLLIASVYGFFLFIILNNSLIDLAEGGNGHSSWSNGLRIIFLNVIAIIMLLV